MATRKKKKSKRAKRAKNPQTIHPKVLERLYQFENKLDSALDLGERLETHLTGELKAIVQKVNEAMSEAQEAIENLEEN